MQTNELQETALRSIRLRNNRKKPDPQFFKKEKP